MARPNVRFPPIADIREPVHAHNMSGQMNRVYVLHHVRKDDEYGDDAKLIGVYRSQEAIDAAIARLAKQPGFRDYPEGFSTDAYELDQDHWSEGFVDLSDLH